MAASSCAASPTRAGPKACGGHRRRAAEVARPVSPPTDQSNGDRPADGAGLAPQPRKGRCPVFDGALFMRDTNGRRPPPLVSVSNCRHESPVQGPGRLGLVLTLRDRSTASSISGLPEIQSMRRHLRPLASRFAEEIPVGALSAGRLAKPDFLRIAVYQLYTGFAVPCGSNCLARVGAIAILDCACLFDR
jgi:hypothetical protein